MTSRERLLAAIKCDTPDRVPVGPWGVSRLDWNAPLTKEFIRTVDPFIETGCGINLIWGAEIPTKTVDEGDTSTSVLRTPMGDLHRVVRRTSITSAQTSFYCRTAEDAEKVLAIPFVPDDFDLSDFFRLRDEVREEGLVLTGIPDAMCWAAELFSPEDFSILWIDAPDAMRKLVRTAADRINEGVERLAAAGVDAFRIVGGEYASVQLGPQAFEELVVGPDSELCEIIHRHNGIAHFHNHGPVKRFYDLFLRIGIDSLDPLEAWPWGDCDLAEAKAKLKGSICIVGNLDDMEVIDKLPWEEVEPIARERLAAAGPDGFVLGGTSSGTYTEAGVQNFMRLVPLAEEMANTWI